MMQWEHVIKVALLGTERQPLTLPATASNRLVASLSRLDTSDPEGAMLGAAALFAASRRAGWQPLLPSVALPAPTTAETLPECSPRAASHLATMLDGQYKEALPEWLALVQQQGMRVPARSLPALLDAGSKHGDIARALLPVLGERGRWLAAQNPAWAYLQENGTWDIGHIWDTGNTKARTVLLEWLRTTDPARARTLLETSWRTHKAEERRTLLATLQTNLSMDDEPFLESILNDTATRSEAVHLLTKLPPSRLVQRMIARVQALLRFEQGSLTVTLPEQCTPDMQRDGIKRKPPPHDERQPEHVQALYAEQGNWWLLQLLKMVSPALLCEQCAITPEQLVAAARLHPLREVLVRGWADALMNQPYDAAWFAALYPLLPADVLEQWFAVLPPPMQRTLLEQRLTAHLDSLRANLLLLASYQQWDVQLARTVLAGLRSMVGETTTYKEPVLFQTLPTIIQRIPFELIDEMVEHWPTDAKRWQFWVSRIGTAQELLCFRAEMHAAFHGEH
ncbi:MAG: hypothetical protein HC876_14875 [Chloroflexaceae bacterium]|nr:hypothetical protein [Chloroflexaceae bacterium]